METVVKGTYTNADIKTYQCLRLHMKMICLTFHILQRLLFEIYTPETYEMFAYKHTETIEYVKK